ncbi:MFS transporter [Paraburkholderia sp. J67]|uniref:spinster family MFS transporter n=1 Tax=Paraburkholderia sp. J67 TaxID=2805435 RepID=UPI002ABDD88C|nr:MFS transporter [Paraburkholderia sp. J67]
MAFPAASARARHDRTGYIDEKSHSVRPGRTKSLYILALVSLISLMCYYDRFLVAIVTQAIKAELHLSDGEVGLLSGIAFALVYSLLAVPIARFSDAGRRVGVLSVALLVWSGMTALCGAATSFPMLLLARLGVGVGEAGGNPTMHALISETFERRWRGTALSAVVVVGGLGFMAASSIGGWIVDHWGWRAAFYAGAIPGPLLALLLRFTVREPAMSAPNARHDSLVCASRTLMKRRAFCLLSFGIATCAIGSFAMLSWTPAFLMRHYHITAAQVGSGYGLTMGVSTVAAMLVGGVLADTLSRRDARWSLWLPAVSYALALPFTIAFLFESNLTAALLLVVPMTFAGGLATPPAYALVQSLSGPRLRATGSALFLLLTNLIGMGVGPSLTGWLSDLFAPTLGANALRAAMLVAVLSYLIGAVLMFRGSRTLIDDIETAERH